MSWKPCSDELPDSDTTVIIFAADDDEPVWLGYHDGEDWRTAEGNMTGVSHWMPIPEPPDVE